MKGTRPPVGMVQDTFDQSCSIRRCGHGVRDDIVTTTRGELGQRQPTLRIIDERRVSRIARHKRQGAGCGKQGAVVVQVITTGRS